MHPPPYFHILRGRPLFNSAAFGWLLLLGTVVQAQGVEPTAPPSQMDQLRAAAAAGGAEARYILERIDAACPVVVKEFQKAAAKDQATREQGLLMQPAG